MAGATPAADAADPRGLPAARTASETKRPPGAGGTPDAPPSRLRAVVTRERGLVAPLLVAALGTALVLARWPAHGPALHWDSIHYLAVARNLLAGEGFVAFDGSAYTLWPPLYPLFLLLAALPAADPLAVAGSWNALFFGATVFVVGRYLQRRLASDFLKLWAPLTLALSLTLTELSWWVLTEPLFILLLTLALVATDEALDPANPGKRSEWGPLLRAGIWAGLAWQTRYIGVAVPAAIGLLLLFAGRASFRERARRVAVFSLLSGAPMALWLFRNTLRLEIPAEPARPLAGGPGFREELWDAFRLGLQGLTGKLPAYEGAWRVTLAEVRDSLLSWTQFDLSPWPVLAAALLIPVAAALLGPRRLPGGPAAPLRRGRPGLVFGVFALVYLTALVVGLNNTPEARFVAPACVPLLVAAAAGADRLLARLREQPGERPGDRSGRREPLPAGAIPARRLLAAGVVAALSAWTAGQIAPNARLVRRANAEDLFLEYSFTARPWSDLRTVRFLREQEPADLVFSNLPILTYHLAEGQGTHRGLPGDRPGRLSSPAGLPSTPRAGLEEWLRGVPDGARIVWFSDLTINGFFEFGVPAMRVTPALAPLADFPDGAVFEVRRREAGNRGGRPAEAPNPYRAAWERVASGAAGPPAARSTFAVHLEETQVLYTRQPCVREDLRPKFVFHLLPPAASDPSDPSAPSGPAPAAAKMPEMRPFMRSFLPLALSPESRRRGGFENRDFRFFEHGVILDEETASPKCVAVVPLARSAEEEFAAFTTGQWTGEGPALWEATVRLDRRRLRVAAASLAAASPEAAPEAVPVAERRREPAARALFDLHLEDDGLLYHRPRCSEADAAARFFLHLYPADPGDLPEARREYGFENHDFDFADHGLLLPAAPEGPEAPEETEDPEAPEESEAAGDAGSACVALAPLPGWEIARLRTGQWAGGEEPPLWEAEIHPEAFRRRARQEAILSGSAREPTARSKFHLWLDRPGGRGDTLTYFRAPCSAADVAPRFFLHLYPEDPEVLPEARREFRFDNRDWNFPDFGEVLDGDSGSPKCLATIPLPDWELLRLRTGQWTARGRTLWAVDLAPPRE